MWAQLFFKTTFRKQVKTIEKKFKKMLFENTLFSIIKNRKQKTIFGYQI